MRPNTRRGLRNLLLSSIYTLSILGVLASGDGDDDFVRRFTCGLSVQGIAPVGDGTVWIGVFAKTDSDTEDRVVLLDTDGSELLSYLVGDGGTENAVRAVARATDGTGDIYIGGDFTGGILRLNDDATLDGGFVIGTGFNGRVTSIAPQANGEVYVGGYFSDYDGNAVSGLVRLNDDGSWDNLEFITVGVTDVESVAVGTDAPHVGLVYSGGTGANPIARWTGGPINGGLDSTFTSALNPVFSVIPAADTTGDIYVGGAFTNGIDRLDNTGTPITVFNANVGTGFDSDVLSIDRSASGGIYVGGDFTAYDGNNSDGIVRINGNGTLDGAFLVGTGFTDLNGIFPFSKVATVVQDTGGSDDVFVGGGFTEYNGVASNGIVRLDTVGSQTAFDVSINIDGEVCNSQTIPDS